MATPNDKQNKKRMTFFPNLKDDDTKTRLAGYIGGGATGFVAFSLIPGFNMAAGVAAVGFLTSIAAIDIYNNGIGKLKGEKSLKHFGFGSLMGTLLGGIIAVFSQNVGYYKDLLTPVSPTTVSPVSTAHAGAPAPVEDGFTFDEEPVVQAYNPLDRVADLIASGAFITQKQRTIPAPTPVAVVDEEPVVTTEEDSQQPCGEQWDVNVICFYPRNGGDTAEPVVETDVAAGGEPPLPLPEVAPTIVNYTHDFTGEATDLYNAAINGNAQAVKDLAFFLYNGINVEQDKALAYDLYTMAADMGNLQAKVDLTYIGYHGLEDIVTPDQDAAIGEMSTYVDQSTLAADLYAAWTGVPQPEVTLDVIPAPAVDPVYPRQETVEAEVTPDAGTCGYSTQANTICFYPRTEVNTEPHTVSYTYNIVADCDYAGLDDQGSVTFANCSFHDNEDAPRVAHPGDALKVNNLPEELEQESQYFELARTSNSVRLDDLFKKTVAPTIARKVLSL